MNYTDIYTPKRRQYKTEDQRNRYSKHWTGRDQTHVEAFSGQLKMNHMGAVTMGALFVILTLIKNTTSSTAACSVSRSTVQTVSKCPITEEEWKKASQIKNCSVFASQCSDPDKFLYHCVINSFLNETIEVCANKKIILLGFCTEYSNSANRIQQSFKTNCTKFSRHPCPPAYSSTEAYKYPECYELTMKSTTKYQATLIHDTSVTTDLMQTVPVFKKSPVGSNDEEGAYFVLEPMVGSITAVLLLFSVIIAVHMCKKFLRKKQDQSFYLNKGNENESDLNSIISSGSVIEASSEERDALLYPSGEYLKNKIKGTRGLGQVRSPRGPGFGFLFHHVDLTREKRNSVPSGKPAEVVNLIKPIKELTEENDCRMLVNALSDGLERLAILQSVENTENYDENNKMLNVFASKIYVNGSNFTNETSTTIHEYLGELESLERYFQRKKGKENKYLPPD